MSKLLALVTVSVPGDLPGHLRDEAEIIWLKNILENKKIDYNFVDTVMGWGNLNQDWLEFRTEVETSWGWCSLSCLSKKESEEFFAYLSTGSLLMQITYIKTENGKETFVPHY